MPRGSSSQVAYIGGFSQFVSIYTRSLRYASLVLPASEHIDLTISKDTLLKLISLLVGKKDETSQANTEVLQEFVVLLTVPPAPFKNSKID
mmetsp:Transcript_6474/g.7754  ORF Transcript_6474/g.7754 Transcript_6474/m.7754 type:complete len:91 (+) Transcript_6474:513-785(+)